MILHNITVNLGTYEFRFIIEVNSEGHWPVYRYTSPNYKTTVKTVNEFAIYCYRYVADLEEQIREYNAEWPDEIHEEIPLISSDEAIAFKSQLLELQNLVDSVGCPIPDDPIPF